MIKVSRKGTLRGADSVDLGGAIVILADEGLARTLMDDELRARIRAEAASAAGVVVWVDDARRLTTLAYGADGCVLRPLSLPQGLTLPPGATVDTANAAELIIRTAAGSHEVRLSLEGSATGALCYRGACEADASIRYFYPLPEPAGAVGPGSLACGAFRFRIFLPNAAITADVRYDPARPYDPAHSRALPRSAAALPSGFRTRWGRVVTLAALPPHASFVQAWDPVLKRAYTTLDGLWAWAVQGGEADAPVDLMPGFSGTEYLRVPGAWVLRFVAGAPAYAHRFHATGAAARGDQARAATDDFALVDRVPGVAEEVTTAWVYMQPAPVPNALPRADAERAGYFSQPQRAGLFGPQDQGSILRALSLESAVLPLEPPPGPAPAAGFPAVPYAGLNAAAALPLVRRFESEVLAAARTAVIYSFPAAGPRGLASSPAALAGGPWGRPGATSPTGPSGPTGPTGPVEYAVTPQGVLCGFSAGFKDWLELVLAQNTGQRLAYTQVRGKLREALLANQLFLVVSDVGKLYEHCSTTYRVTQPLIDALRGEQAPNAVIDAANQLVGRLYHARSYFTDEVKRLLGDEFKDWGTKIADGAEQAQLTIAGWTFDLASARWSGGDAPTMLIIKFGDTDLRTLAGELSRWTLPAAFNADPAKTQQALVDFLDRAMKRAPTEPELQPFVGSVLGDGKDGRGPWNGVLYLNAAVPTNAFPPEIAALAAGLPPGPLRAHHLGVSLSSFQVVQDRVVQLDDSSLFGLILYDDPADLVFQGAPYDFKVLSLRMRFANSAVASFTSQVELLVARLFGELGTLQDSLRGNNLLLDGTLQEGAYRFSTAVLSRFAMDSRVLDTVTVARARFVSVPDDRAPARTVACFILDGSMEFRRLDGFDLFGFGPAESPADGGELVFSNLLVSMDFDPTDPTAKRTFDFVAGQMALDPGSSRARPASLPRRFPLRAVAMRQGGRATDAQGQAKTAGPSDLGFIPVETPLGEDGLADEWYGLEMALSFGGPGALAPKLGVTGALLAAWSPAADAPKVAVGIRLPGSEGGKKSLTIMGPLKLGIGRLNFLYDRDTKGYLLRLQNVALSFLGLSFPPGGKTNALLFGDPDPKASNNALGWYLAYKKDKEKKDEGEPPRLESINVDTHPRSPRSDIDKGGCDTCPQ